MGLTIYNTTIIKNMTYPFQFLLPNFIDETLTDTNNVYDSIKCADVYKIFCEYCLSLEGCPTPPKRGFVPALKVAGLRLKKHHNLDVISGYTFK